MQDSTLLLFFSLSFDFLTIGAIFLFLFKFFRIKEKTPGLYMMLVLCILDLNYPIFNFFVTVIVSDKQQQPFYGYTRTGLNRLCLWWSAAMAVYCYMILTLKKSVNPKRFMVFGGLGCILASLICPLM